MKYNMVDIAIFHHRRNSKDTSYPYLLIYDARGREIIPSALHHILFENLDSAAMLICN